MKKRMNLMVVAALLLLTTACKKETVNDKEVMLDSLSAPRPKTMPEIRPEFKVPADGKYPQMTFEKEEHEFGKLVEGEKVSYAFKF